MKDKFLDMGSKRILFLAVLVAGLVILVVQVGRTQLFQKRASGGTATIILTPNANSPVSVPVNGTFNVVVSLNPNNNPLVGADVALNFPNNLLTVTNIQIPTTFTNNTLHTYAPVKSDGSGAFDGATAISKANTSGTIEISALAFDYNPSPGQVLTPQSTAVSPFATITFTSKAVGTGQVKIKYTINSTTDSNLVSNASGTPVDVIADSTATAIDSTVNFTVASPTAIPSTVPTTQPTGVPTTVPTIVPTAVPTAIPTSVPTGVPTATGVQATPTGGATVPPTQASVPGDSNHDNHVDGLDYVAWLNGYKLYNNQQTNQGATVGDFNVSGFVDGLDYIIWRNNYGR